MYPVYFMVIGPNGSKTYFNSSNGCVFESPYTRAKAFADKIKGTLYRENHQPRYFKDGVELNSRWVKDV